MEWFKDFWEVFKTLLVVAMFVLPAVMSKIKKKKEQDRAATARGETYAGDGSEAMSETFPEIMLETVPEVMPEAVPEIIPDSVQETFSSYAGKNIVKKDMGKNDKEKAVTDVEKPDFDPKKMIIYSEIMNPKYID